MLNHTPARSGSTPRFRTGVVARCEETHKTGVAFTVTSEPNVPTPAGRYCESRGFVLSFSAWIFAAFCWALLSLVATLPKRRRSGPSRHKWSLSRKPERRASIVSMIRWQLTPLLNIGSSRSTAAQSIDAFKREWSAPRSYRRKTRPNTRAGRSSRPPIAKQPEYQSLSEASSVAVKTGLLTTEQARLAEERFFNRYGYQHFAAQMRGVQ
jgi:hypothetical protein